MFLGKLLLKLCCLETCWNVRIVIITSSAIVWLFLAFWLGFVFLVLPEVVFYWSFLVSSHLTFVVRLKPNLSLRTTSKSNVNSRLISSPGRIANFDYQQKSSNAFVFFFLLYGISSNRLKVLLLLFGRKINFYVTFYYGDFEGKT